MNRIKTLVLQFIFMFATLVFASCSSDQSRQSDNQNKILFLGVAHFGKLQESLSYNVNSPEEQLALNSICEAVSKFQPDRIYIEVQRQFQTGLEGEYNRYLQGAIDPMNTEIDQLAFRCGSAANLSKIYALDLRPKAFDHEAMLAKLPLKQRIQKTRQDSVDEKIMINTIDEILNSGTITDLIYHLNSPAEVNKDVSDVLSILSYGEPNDTLGVETVSEWYARHIDMWSFVQKSADKNSDNRIVVIMGASHTSLLRQFVQSNPNWQVVELIDLM